MATSKDDEKVMQYLASTSTKECHSIIFDARPLLSAQGNHVRGGGYEKSANYSHSTVEFLGIQNIHSVRESFVRLHGMFSKVQSNNHHQGEYLSSFSHFQSLSSFICFANTVVLCKVPTDGNM
jgi:hypothetical protein